MKKSGLWLVGCAALLIALASCESGKDPVWILETDNGKTISVFNGNTLEVKLWGDPSTGYIWNAGALTNNVLTFESEEYQSDSGMTNSGGYYYFCYKAEKCGESLIHIVYYRESDPVLPPEKTFEVTIMVQP